MRLSTKIFYGFILVIIFSIAGLLVYVKLSGDVNRNSEFVRNSEEIVRNSAKLHKTILEMQSGFRGYLLSGNESFLISYNEGIKSVPELFNLEKLLVVNSNGQLKKLNTIQASHKEWVEYANKLIAAKRLSMVNAGDSKEYDELMENKFKKQFGQKINDDISIAFKNFDRYEYRIREKRRQSLAASIVSSRNIAIAIVIIIAMIGLISALYITHIISKRISSMVNVADRISKGDFSIIEDLKNDELTKLSKSLTLMSMTLHKNFTDLERQNKELDQFAHVVSHDLKAPLRGMNNLFSWIEEDLEEDLSEPLKKYHNKMKEKINRLENLITGLLEYARIGREDKEYEYVNTELLLKDIVEMIVPIKFNVSIQNNMPVILTERIRLEQVFSNLLSNAVKFNDNEKPAIDIKYRDTGDYFEFSVSDNGIGVEQEYHNKIFIIFQTLSMKNEKQSTGIGLSIVKKIIDEQKGDIKILSEKDKGLTFVFTWPKKPINEINQYLI